MGHSIVQHVKADASSTSPAGTLAACVAGNIILAIVGFPGFSTTLGSMPSGFARVGGTHNNGPSDSNLELWSKVAVGGETVIGGTLSGSGHWGVVLAEVSALQSTVDQSSESPDGSSFGVSSLSLGTTGTTTVANALALGAVYIAAGSTVPVWTTGGYTALESVIGGGGGMALFVATKDLTTLATQSATPSWTGAGDCTGALWTFGDTAPVVAAKNRAIFL